MTRPKVFVGVRISEKKVENISQGDENFSVLAVLLFQSGLLPVMPTVYEALTESQEEAEKVRLELLSECQSAVWLDEPTAAEKQMCVELGIATHSVE